MHARHKRRLHPNQIFNEVKSTYCFANMHEDEWREVLYHITAGGKALEAYDEYKKWKTIMVFTV